MDEWHTYFVAGGVLVHNGCKRDIKQVYSAAKDAGIPPNLRRDFGDYIEELKHESGKKNNDNFTYRELLEVAKEFLEWNQ